MFEKIIEFIAHKDYFDLKEDLKDPDSYAYEHVMREYSQRYTGVTDDELAAVMRGEVEDDVIEENIMEILTDSNREYYREYVYRVRDPETMPDYEVIGNDEMGYTIISPDRDVVASDVYSFSEAQVEAQQHALEYGLLNRDGAQWEEYKQDEPITEDKIWPAPQKA